MTALVSVEFAKLRTRMMTWVLALLLVGLVVLLYAILWSVSARVETFGEEQQFSGAELRRALFLETSVPFSLQIVASLGGVLAIILAAGAVGSEYAWGTVRLMATATPGRVRYLVAKLVVVLALVAAGTVLAVVVGLAVSTIITLADGGSDFGFLTWSFAGDQARAFFRTLYVLLPYVTMAFAAAVVGRSTLAGVGVGLGVGLIEPFVSSLMLLGGNPWNDIPNLLLNANVQAVILQNEVPEVARFGPGDDELSTRGLHSPEDAALILLAYTALFVTVALVTYRRRDITAAQ